MCSPPRPVWGRGPGPPKQKQAPAETPAEAPTEALTKAPAKETPLGFSAMVQGPTVTARSY